MSKPDGGPAFPASIPTMHSDEQGKDYPCFEESGMTLRDYFAAKALPAMLADFDYEKATRHAYQIADLMLAERKR